MKQRSSRDCKEAGDTLTLGTTDQLRARRADKHLEQCAGCQQDEQIMEGLRQSVLGANDSLDDLTRARVQGRLAEAMQQATEGESRSSGARGVGTWAAAAALLVLVGGLMLWWGSTREPRQQLQTQTPASAGTPTLAQLEPRSILQGSAPWPNSGLVLGQKVARVEVPAGVALRAVLSNSTDLTLYGPLELAVESAGPQRLVVRLSRGTLVGELQGGQGRTLRILSPRAVTEIVGTLFSVEAHDGQTRVSVSRGKVKVRAAGKTVVLGANKTWQSASARVEPIPSAVLALLVKMDRPALTPAAAVTDRPAPGQATPPPVPRGASRPAPTAPPARPRAVVPPRAPRTPAPPRSPAASTPDAGTAPAPVEAPAVEPAPALYRKAEQALARRDTLEARRMLSRILQHHPGHALADAARYDLALLLLKAGQRTRAEAVLRKITQQANGASRLAGPALFLRCRIKKQSGDTSAAVACYKAFRDRYPTSPHHPQALQELIRLLVSSKDCGRARGFIADYLALHPRSPFADEARRLRRECRQ